MITTETIRVDGQGSPAVGPDRDGAAPSEAIEIEDGLHVGRQLAIGLGMVLFLTVLTGLVYPLVVTGIAQVAFPRQANGSMVTNGSGQVVGSALLGQVFTDTRYFYGRPSAGALFNPKVDTVPGVSGGTNLGPTNAQLVLTNTVQAANTIRSTEGISGSVPVDLATSSGSGLDPHITSASARLQVQRVAKARNLPADQVQQLVAQYTEGRDLGLLGEPRVNVLKLNLALDALQGGHR